MAKRKTLKSTSAIGVATVPTNSLTPNPHNPRMLFDREPLNILRNSIKRVGILVPLTVYKDKQTGRLVILDGQRRWICAQEVGLARVPVNQIAHPTLVQNIVTMFQIHKLREDWELMPTALKIELLMEEIQETNETRVAELTGLEVAVVTRCKKLISYDKEFQDLMLDPDPEKRIKADFFIELYPVLHDRYVSKFQWFRKKRFIRQMLDKYLNEPRTIKAVTDFRQIKQHITNARRIGALKEFSRRFRRFAGQRDVSLATLEIEEASVHAEAKSLIKRINSLEDFVRDIDADQFYGEEDLWVAIRSLIKVLEGQLKAADKRR